MIEAAIAPNEEARLHALQSLKLLHTPREERFDRITRIAAPLFEMPVVTITLVGRDEQWFKSCIGLESEGTPRNISFCSHAILQEHVLIVPDTLLDARFFDNPLVTGEPRIRFYAGHPLRAADGSKVGTLCLIDHQPREFGARKIAQLADLAAMVQSELNAVELQSALQQLAQSDRAFEKLSRMQHAILDGANCSILSTDARGIIQTFNATSERWTGYRAGELIGKETPALIHLEAEIVQRAAELSEKLGRPVAPGVETIAAYGGLLASSQESEWTCVRKDGSHFPMMISFCALRDGNGAVSGYMGIGRDVTEQKQGERAMRLAKEEAEEANRTKSRFLANMSHEVRTPLNAILGINGMLLEAPLEAPQRQLAETVQSSGQALLDIVNDILEFSKIEAGHLSMNAEDFSVRDLVDGVVELHCARASNRGIVLHTELAAGVPEWVCGDAGRLRQVLNNLVGNALKFSEYGTVWMHVQALEPGGGLLRFAVRDEGIGVPPEAQARIFEAFVQADTSTTRNYGGTGLGLSICKQIVELMGGQIGLQSAPGKGSTFWFTVRLAPASTAARQNARIAAGPRVSAPAPEPLPLVAEGRPLRVLLAEDNKVNRMVALHQLKTLGCEVREVENGRAALEALETGSFDVILMDGQMPLMDGYATTREIRRREQGTARHVWIVALTANAMAGERERCLALGMDDYLSKPFRRPDLVAALSSVLLASAPAAPDAPPLLGAEQIAQLRDLGAGVLTEMAEIFRAESRVVVEQIAEAIAARDLRAIQTLGHKLKGSSGSFGAWQLEASCGVLENLPSLESPARLENLCRTLRLQLQAVQRALDEEIAQDQ